ncbi:UDP-N-acetylmuramate dehydrogenase [Patescibacteria group bacterium]|nr:MAG: UDP-N-acetylmuramate dehydrogenase [Patescibacteria group bacterium]
MPEMNLENQLREIVGGRLLLNEPMSRHTNFRLGGPADRFVVAESREEAIGVFQALADSKTPYFVLGGGSNIIVADQGYRGTVVQMALRHFEINGVEVTAESGVLAAALSRATVNSGVSGLEWAIGLPGTVGGAVRGNAGCWGGEMKDSVKSVEVLVIKNSSRVEREEWPAEKCGFGYRTSVFKHLSPAPIILSANLLLQRGVAAQSAKLLREIIEKRKDKQPLQNSSAGCIFKNIELRGDEDLQKLRQDAALPAAVTERRQIPVGWLIEQAGLKGFAVGGARISDKHGNFCVNTGRATAAEVLELISAVKSRVFDRYGLRLEEEIVYLGF